MIAEAQRMPSSYSLGEHYERFIRGLVDSGRYVSASEVLRDSLRLLEEQEALREIKLQKLREAIQEGLDSPRQLWDVNEFLAEAEQQLARETATDDAD
jgi:antitoxin ParD1/3/4